MSELSFDDCRVPGEQLLGKRGQRDGRSSTTRSSGSGASSSPSTVGTHAARSSSGIGTLRHERRQFGQPIGQFQAVSHRIVDMKVRLETARLLLYRTAG